MTERGVDDDFIVISSFQPNLKDEYGINLSEWLWEEQVWWKRSEVSAGRVKSLRFYKTLNST